MPLHQYFWSITVKVRWCSYAPEPVVCGHWRNIWCRKKKEQVKREGKKIKNTPAHLRAFRRSKIRDVCSLIPQIRQHNVWCSNAAACEYRWGKGAGAHNAFSSCEIEIPGTQRQYAGDDYDLLLPGCSRAIKAYSPKFPFNKESENENIIFSRADGNCCFLTAGV